MLTFEPKQLSQVNKYLKERRMYKCQVEPQLNDEYLRLFQLIGHSALSHVAGWNYILSQAEVLLICQYLLEQSESSEQEVLVAIVNSRLDKDILRFLYDFSQDNLRNIRLHELLRYFGKNQKMGELFYNTYEYGWEDYVTAFLQYNTATYINSIAGQGSLSSKTGYTERLKSMGILPSSALYLECSKLFITVCNGAEYMRLGAEEIKNMMMKQTDSVQTSLLKNMLRNLDSFQLRSFFPVLDHLYERIGSPGCKAYNEFNEGLTLEEIEKYKLWIKQYKIAHYLKDNDRSSFWMPYVKDCMVLEGEDCGVLLLKFKDFTVIEFIKANQVAYFYDNKYMEEVVNEGIAAATSEDKLEEWLFLHTEWRAQGEHRNHWRKAHRDNWQTDMRDYIFQRSNPIK